MDLPYSQEELRQATHDMLAANEMGSCYVRPIAFRGYGELGINPLNCPVDVVIAVWPWGAYLGEEALESGVRVTTSSWRRIGPNTVPAAAKASGQYLNSQLAKIEALKAGFDEAILLNEQGFLADGSGENVFVVRDGVLSTPPTTSSCLPGITRETVIRIARDKGYEVHERDVVRTDLYHADEVFFTGTAAEVTPIRSVDDHEIGPGPITREIQQEFFAITHGRSPLSDEYLDFPDRGPRALMGDADPGDRALGAGRRGARGGARARGAALGHARARAEAAPLRERLRVVHGHAPRDRRLERHRRPAPGRPDGRDRPRRRGDHERRRASSPPPTASCTSAGRRSSSTSTPRR